MASSNFLARWRIARGLSQADLAKRVGLKREAVARYESGNSEPGVTTALRLAAALARRGVPRVEHIWTTSEPDSLLKVERVHLRPVDAVDPAPFAAWLKSEGLAPAEVEARAITRRINAAWLRKALRGEVPLTFGRVDEIMQELDLGQTADWLYPSTTDR